MSKSESAAFLGVIGERVAEEFLVRRHYRIIERNWRGAYGELDLIVTSPEGELVIVEVKTRSSARYGAAVESIDSEKYRRLHLLARQWSLAHGLKSEYRIDVVALDDFALPKISHRIRVIT